MKRTTSLSGIGRDKRKQIAQELINTPVKEIKLLAQKYNVSESTVRHCGKEFGVPLKYTRHLSVKTLEILKLLLDGNYQSQIVRKLKVSKQRVNQLVNEAKAVGIHIPKYPIKEEKK